MISGAAGLIYESIWSRYLGLFVGHSAYAQIIVLVIFLGGMSLGAWLAGRRAARITQPLLWYAGIEFVVGVIGLLFHDIFVATTNVAYDRVFPGVDGAGLITIKWIIASALILPQSILLGATFPLMSGGIIRLTGSSEPGRILGLLYFANSLGAAAGVLVAGFYLIGEVGLQGTLFIAGYANVLVAAAVFLMARHRQRTTANVPVAVQPELLPATENDGLWRPLLLVSFGTAVASFIYEIAWIRMLSLVLGSATHAFELMLSAFILGLALGALWIRKRADRVRDPIFYLGVVQWAMGALAVATLPLYVQSFDWISALLATLESNERGYRVFQLGRYGIALLVMLPATFCAGMTLPLITRVLLRTRAGESAIGSVYAVNTLGSIIGVILAGLVLMPVLGLKRLLVFGAAIDILIGIWLIASRGRWMRTAPAEPRPAWRFGYGSPLVVPVIATAAVLTGIALAARFDLGRLTSGVYRHGVVDNARGYAFPFYRDGRTATVSVRRNPDGFVTLATNGKPDASMERAWLDTSDTNDEQVALRRDIATQLLLPLITLAHAPHARDVAIIGHGSGMSSHVLLGSPTVREAVTIEIEPEMIEASRLFRPANERVFSDARSSFVIDDAKSYFASSRRRFDLILSEPSNPWVSGVSGLFTVEFYQRVRSQLAPNGVFGQWLHLYELSDALVTAVISAIDAVFESYEVFFTSNSDILIVAADGALRQPDWGVTQLPGIARDLRRVIPLGPETLEALRLGNREVLHPLVLSHTGTNSDFYPLLDLNAERMRFMHQSADGYIELAEGRFDVVAALSGRRAGFGTLGVTAAPEIDRAAALALGTRLRMMRAMTDQQRSQIPRDQSLREALYRTDALMRIIDSDRPPADWTEFVKSVREVDADLHSGTAGVVDQVFFARVRAYANRHGAPAEARASLDFLHGIGAWNWAEVAAATNILMESADTLEWLPDELLRNGGAVAYIKLQDTTGAKKVLQTYARRTYEDRFRERMIASYLVYQDTTLRRRRRWQ